MKAPLIALCLCCLLAGPASAETRTFRNAKGEAIQAEIVSATAEKVELKRSDGKVFTVAIATLSDEDREWITKWRATHKQVKIGVTAEVKRAISRTEKGAAMGGGDLKGNDSWFALVIRNSGVGPMTGLRVESIIFGPPGAPKVSEIIGADVPAVAAGKTQIIKTAKLFVPQTETVISSGLSTVKRATEGSPAGVYAELMLDGKRVGVFKAGQTAPDSEQQLQQWRAGQPVQQTPAPADPKEKPKTITPGDLPMTPGTKVSAAGTAPAPDPLSGVLPVATYSIVARDPQTGELGVAVQSKFFGVGSVVPWAKAGVGAVATQSYANTAWGPEGLRLLGEGKTAEETLALLTKQDELAASRQAGIIAPAGKPATFTGDGCMAFAAGRTGEHYTVQGNILAGQPVVDGMAEAFEKTAGPLPVRMLAALDAAQAAGGDKRGMQSAAILVVREGWGYAGRNDRWIDLRVEDHSEPLKELRRLFDLHQKMQRPSRY